MSAQLDLLPREAAKLPEGVIHVPGWLSLKTQQDLLVLLRHVTHNRWYTPSLPNGTPMKHPISCVGWAWRPYEYFRMSDHVPMPDPIVALARKALLDADVACLGFQPDTGIINLFPHDSSLGMHQDRSEHPDLIAAGSPIITVSLGESAMFRVGNAFNQHGPFHDVELRSGDLIVMHGAARSHFHAVTKILPNTAPGLEMSKPVRISLTIRQALKYDR